MINSYSCRSNNYLLLSLEQQGKRSSASGTARNQRPRGKHSSAVHHANYLKQACLMIGLQKGTKALQVMQVSYNITGGERAVLVVVARGPVRHEIAPVPVVSVAPR